ncbi:MAG TPA: endolytic transglycosylase MltG [Bacteroidales bacterium]
MKNKKILYLLIGAGILILVILFVIYTIMFSTGITPVKKNQVLYISTGSSYNQVFDSLKSNLIIKNLKVLKWIAKRKSYQDKIKPGRYVINKSLSYNSLINMLRSGRQSPVRITFNNVRTLNQIAGKIGRQLEADSSQIIGFLSDDSNYTEDGFKKENIIDLFIPNTYEFYWNTNARELYTRMLKEYKLFWNDQRLSKAKEKGLDPKEVSILASIIDDEVSKPEEKPRIAGVYLNRLTRGMPLQSCPTIKFALNDFSITRVLKKYLTIDSPYNTYEHTGYPPGPIGCSTIEGIDAVLNAEKHDYLYFAARADFSGYHNFSRTLSEHNRYALLYQKELDKRKIFK